MKIGPRELLFFLVLLGMPVAYWWFVHKPGAEQIALADKENAAKRQKLEQLDAVAHYVQDMGPEIQKLTEAIAIFEAKLPAEKEVDVILKQVSQLTSRHGLKSPFLRAEKATISARYGEQPLKMKVQGDFNGYYGFLLDIERLARITRIPQMKLTKIKDEEGRLEAEFTLNIYFESQGGGEKIAHVSAERLGQR